MKANLVKLELFLGKRGWVISAMVILLFQLMFSGFSDMYMNNPDVIKMIETMPPALLEGFGMDAEMMTTYEGWMGGEPYTFYVLLLGSFAAIWASSSIAKEKDQQTGEFLFSLPYSRGQIFASKAAAHFIQVTVVFLLNFMLVLGGGWLFSTVKSAGTLLLLSASGYLTALAFAGIGYAVTAFLSSERAAMSFGIGVVIIMFLLNLLSALNDKINWLANFSLFHVFVTKDIIHHQSLAWAGVLITLSIYAAGLLLAQRVLKHQDL